MDQTLKDIFTPNVRKVVLAVLFAIFWHYYLLEQAIRQSTHAELGGVKDFWVSNFVSVLPYFETDSTILRFIIFFVGSYAVVWVFSKILTFFGNAQVQAVKTLRRKS